MILGTWGAAYFTYYYGPYIGILGAALLGAIGGALHALATVNFGVDHIVSGVAINIIGLGAARFLSEAYFANLEGGGVKQLTGLDKPPNFTVPGRCRRRHSAVGEELVRRLRRRPRSWPR